jgi:transposase-like protein
VLNQLTRNVLETALEAELTEHLGHEHGQTPIAANMRNGTGPKTVLTEIGPVEIEVPRGQDGSFEPVIVPTRKRGDGIDQIALSLSARGLTTGDAISQQAFFHWKNGQAHGPDDLPEAAAELPSRYRVPYMANVA